MFNNKFFDFSNFRGDILGGLTAGIVALPLALAFGVASGLGPSFGLYGAIFVCFFASLFGGTNTQISGPTAPMTALSMVIIAGIIQINDNDVERALPLILAVFLLSGLIQILLGLAQVGTYIKYIPSTVVSGFMTAIGVIILITQILPSIGYYPEKDSGYVSTFMVQAEENILEDIIEHEEKENIMVLDDLDETVFRAEHLSNKDSLIQRESQALATESSRGVTGTIMVLPRALLRINWLELILALGTIAIIYGFRRFTTKLPSTLVGLIVMSGIAYGFQFNYELIEEIPKGLPEFHLNIFTQFSFSSLLPYVLSAISLALLGSIDSLLTSVVADRMTKTRHKPNRELIGQGIGNSIAALFGGLPGAGATIRTVVNIKSGGKTRLSGMTAALILLIIMLVIGPVASKIPAAVLAGILITVGFDVIDYKGLKSIPLMNKNEVTILFVVIIVSCFYNLVYAVGLGVLIAALIFMKKMGELGKEKTKLKKIKGAKEEAISDSGFVFNENSSSQLFTIDLYGPLFFGYSYQFTELVNKLTDAKVIILNFEKVPFIDYSGLVALEGALEMFAEQDCTVYATGVTGQTIDLFEKSKLIPKENIFDDYEQCMMALNK